MRKTFGRGNSFNQTTPVGLVDSIIIAASNGDVGIGTFKAASERAAELAKGGKKVVDLVTDSRVIGLCQTKKQQGMVGVDSSLHVLAEMAAKVKGSSRPMKVYALDNAVSFVALIAKLREQMPAEDIGLVLSQMLEDSLTIIDAGFSPKRESVKQISEHQYLPASVKAPGADGGDSMLSEVWKAAGKVHVQADAAAAPAASLSDLFDDEAIAG